MEALKRSVLEEANDATDRAEAMPYPRAEELYDRVYVQSWQPWRETTRSENGKIDG